MSLLSLEMCKWRDASRARPQSRGVGSRTPQAIEKPPQVQLWLNDLVQEDQAPWQPTPTTTPTPTVQGNNEDAGTDCAKPIPVKPYHLHQWSDGVRIPRRGHLGTDRSRCPSWPLEALESVSALTQRWVSSWGSPRLKQEPEIAAGGRPGCLPLCPTSGHPRSVGKPQPGQQGSGDSGNRFSKRRTSVSPVRHSLGGRNHPPCMDSFAPGSFSRGRE